MLARDALRAAACGPRSRAPPRSRCVRQRVGAGGIAHRGQHQELVAAEATDRVVGPHAPAAAPGPRATSSASPAAWPSVSLTRLEAVEVDEEQRHRLRCAAPAAGVDAVHHRAPAERVGQRVALDAASADAPARPSGRARRSSRCRRRRTCAVGVEVGHVARAQPARALRAGFRPGACTAPSRPRARARSTAGARSQRAAPRTSPMWRPSSSVGRLAAPPRRRRG